MICCPYELRAAAQEDVQNFFFLFELHLNVFTLPECVRHCMELEALLMNRNKSLNIFEAYSGR